MVDASDSSDDFTDEEIKPQDKATVSDEFHEKSLNTLEGLNDVTLSEFSLRVGQCASVNTI